MSNNYHDKIPERNEAQDSFNLSKEELMNCFGSQIASQSSKSNYDYQNEYNSPENVDANKNSPNQSPEKNNEMLNKDDLLRNLCHGFIDMFFSQKEELKGIKDEIKKLQNIMMNNSVNNGNGNNNQIINNNVNRRQGNKKPKINNPKSLIFNQNSNNNNSDIFNYTFKNSKKNNYINPSNNNAIFDDQNNQNKKQYMPILANSRLSRSKSPNLITNPKSVIPETVPEVDEEYEFTAARKQKIYNEKETQKNKEILKNNFEDPFLGENSEEKNQIRFEDINDDEFDEILKKGKNKNKMLMNDPFKKSSELKKRPDSYKKEEQNENQINNNNINIIKQENEEKKDDSYIDIENENENNKKNDPDLGMINLDLDEIQSDFMIGNKKVTVKINDNVRKKLTKEMSSLDEPVNLLEELSKNKQPSNIKHINSKLSCSSNMLSKNKNLEIELKLNNNSKSKANNSKTRPGKRNHYSMAENSKKIMEKENMEKKEEEKGNGSSLKEKRGFMKILKRFGHTNDYNLINNMNINKNNIKSNPSSNNNSQNLIISTQKRTIKNKKYMFTTISSCEFYCLCQKQKYLENKDINLIENSRCKICKNSEIINFKNFEQGFYYYILNDINNIPEIKVSDSIFQSLKENIKEMNEKDPNYTTKKELEQFFNYQFIFLVYDKYMKITREKENNSELQIENLIEEIYSKLINKYIQIFVKAKRSFLTEVAEGDSTLGYSNIILFLMNISKSTEPLSEDKIIEFSDGYKSCFATITPSDPINKLLDQIVLHNWINVEIGMSKVINITEDFKVFIKIYYNSISSLENADLNDINYGPLEEPKKFLPKNITELRNDGGEISLINVIIVKKYDYYINNLTKKIRYSRKKFENEIVKIPESSEKKNYNALDSDQKNNMNSNNNEIKEPDMLLFHFKVIAMDYEIYNIIKKEEKNNKNLEHILKKKYTIEFCVRYANMYENIQEGKMYQLMYLNLENKNNSNNNKNNKKYYGKDFQENNIQIRFNDKSQINEIPLNINYKSDKVYKDSFEIINKNLNLTNNIDLGKLFIENEENNKSFDNNDYLDKEFSISGIYSGYLDKVNTHFSTENNNDLNEGNNEEEHLDRYIFLSIGISKIAIIKLHKEDFFYIDVKSNLLKDKIFYCSDVIFKEILYFDEDCNQPKLTGRKKMENSIPLLNFTTNCYTSINYSNFNKNKEQTDLYVKFRDKNKNLIDKIAEVIV